jgi:predicted TIM-barrel fold metal-dependent hydrolase
MAAGKPSRGIDCHAHVFSALAPAVVGARYRPPYEATLAQWQAHWEAAHISGGVLVQPSFFGSDNSELVAAIAMDPARLRGVAVLQPGLDDEALRRLHAAGIRALRLNLRGIDDFSPYADESWGTLLVLAFALGWHVEVFVDTARVPEIAQILAHSPISVLFDHFGVPGDAHEAKTTFNAVGALAATRPVWCKLSAPYRLGGGDPLAYAQRWIDIVGPGQLVWGSDWPWTGHEDAADYQRLRTALDRWVGKARVDAVLWDNAARLYGFA